MKRGIKNGQKNEINILALIDKISSVSTRIRIIQMSDYLERCGVRITIKEIPNSIFNLIKLLNTEEYDLVWWQKKMPNFLNSFLLKFLNKDIIFDFDDNLLVRMKPKKGSYESKGREIKFYGVKKISKGFTCGNAFLSTLIKDTKKPYLIYPTPVPVDVPYKNYFKLDKSFTIGWLGLSAGFIYLDKIISQLAKLKKEFNFRLVVISEEDYKTKYNFVDNIRWTLERQEIEITKFDIGIMPLNTESPYDKGKCGYKLLQYMAAGVIAVGEAYGTNLDIIKNGVNGFLVYDNNWYGTLKRIMKGIQSGTIDYSKISKEAIQTVKEKYSYEVLAPKLATFFRKYLSQQTKK